MLETVGWVVLGYVCGSFVLLGATLGFYIAASKIAEMPNEIIWLPLEVRLMCGAIVFVGRLLSVLSNWFVFTWLLFELPKERFLTTRLVRHKYKGTGKRRKLAVYFSEQWVSPFSHGHCDEQ